MEDTPQNCPKLRPIEAFPIVQEGRQLIGLRDPTGLSDRALTISRGALAVLQLLDGTHTLRDIQVIFARRTGELVMSDDLEKIVSMLTEAHLLEGPEFEAYRAEQIDDYRRRPVRAGRSPEALGIVADGPDGVGKALDEILAQCDSDPDPRPLIGLVAPHLDLPRGAPCYAPAYRALAGRDTVRRFVVMGTNHFGRGAASVVATDKSFETPLGTTPVDTDFLSRIEARCGENLREFDYDHQREHSVEFQVLFLQHLFGPDEIAIVPLLCPDPCFPDQAAPPEARRTDPGAFAAALRDVVAEADAPTCLIAGADLSHVGANFGDDRRLDPAFLSEVETADRQMLAHVESADPEAMVQCLVATRNATRVCGTGSIFTLLGALPQAKPTLLRYHQAVDQPSQTGVTCAAIALHQN